MKKEVIVFFYDDKKRRIPVNKLDHFPLIWGSYHDSMVADAPELKEKELYALYEGTEFLVWPTSPDSNNWSSQLVLGRTEQL